MSIIIRNIGKSSALSRENFYRYEVRINEDVITHFNHKRTDGLAMCLRLAADAVEKHKLDEMINNIRKFL